MIEALRKQLTEQSLNTADLGTRAEKIGAQLRDVQEVSASRNRVRDVGIIYWCAVQRSEFVALKTEQGSGCRLENAST